MIDFFKSLIDFILHIDKHLVQIVSEYQTTTYFILAAIIFCETGLVIMPLLPGDSLLFAAGAVVATSENLNIGTLILVLSVAVILGDNLNYWIGRKLGPKVFEQNFRFLNRKHLEKTQHFYEKYGVRTIVLARYIPIVRTFAPFVAGVGAMRYPRFFMYSLLGGITWIVLFTMLGYFFGNIPAVKRNFTLVIFAIIVLSMLPPLIEYWRQRKQPQEAKP
ncbi:MAG: DedA family protein [Saprospiraceae bacterium]|nr:DedA family protein [Saprospiraceae bacterium]MBP7699870.1 DedA family protein [Saprospiraceae bacterium]